MGQAAPACNLFAFGPLIVSLLTHYGQGGAQCHEERVRRKADVQPPPKLCQLQERNDTRTGRLRHVKTRLAFTSYRRATADTEAPGAADAATISSFSASGQDL